MMAKRSAGRTLQSISDLQPDKRNANKGTVRGLAMLEDSIQQFGAGRSILVDKNGNVIAGNKTLQSAVDADLPIEVVETDGSKLVVVQRTDLDLYADAKARQLAYADNRVAEIDLAWDADALLADLSDGIDLSKLFNPDELDVLLAGVREDAPSDPGPQIDKAAELQKKWQVRRGDLWIIGKHRLLCGDSTDAADVARCMGYQKADCVFTSPPYAVGVDYGIYKDTIENLRAMLPKLSKIFCDVVEDGGFAVINFGDIAGGRDVAETKEPCEYPMALEYWPVFRADGWLLWSRRIWCKPNERVNSMWCIGSNRAATDWEHIWTWRKHGDPIIKRVDGDYRSPLGWYQSSQAAGVEVGKDVHGAGMALSIAEWMLTVHSRPNRVVFEPFTGTGTTTVAAERIGRRCYSVELEPSSCAVALQRLADMGLAPERAEA